ncbi:MAG: hypothetical protein JWP63_1244, partial [Candidatus Solibacter sp.]|nr:hypothetical protein [Candidatus Solibacter sp.]
MAAASAVGYGRLAANLTAMGRLSAFAEDAEAADVLIGSAKIRRRGTPPRLATYAGWRRSRLDANRPREIGVTGSV